MILFPTSLYLFIASPIVVTISENLPLVVRSRAEIFLVALAVWRSKDNGSSAYREKKYSRAHQVDGKDKARYILILHWKIHPVLRHSEYSPVHINLFEGSSEICISLTNCSFYVRGHKLDVCAKMTYFLHEG